MKYRKKPVVIEARKFEYTGECLLELSEWMGANMKTSGKARHKQRWVIYIEENQ